MSAPCGAAAWIDPVGHVTLGPWSGGPAYQTCTVGPVRPPPNGVSRAHGHAKFVECCTGDAS